MISGEAAWVHPEPIALSTTDGARRGTHVNVQPSHQARGRASPRGLNPGRDAGRWRAAAHTSPTHEVQGKESSVGKPRYRHTRFYPRVPGRRGPRAAIRFQSPRLGSPYQPRSGAHHAQGVQNSSLNPGEPPRGGTPLTHSRAESPPEGRIVRGLVGCRGPDSGVPNFLLPTWVRRVFSLRRGQARAPTLCRTYRGGKAAVSSTPPTTRTTRVGGEAAGEVRR
jgi:hypothetical protein